MSQHLEIPADLLSLIEKRELADRRQAGETPAAAEAAAEALELEERRQAARRAEDRDAV